MARSIYSELMQLFETMTRRGARASVCAIAVGAVVVTGSVAAPGAGDPGARSAEVSVPGGAAARMMAGAGAFLAASGVGDETWSDAQRLESATAAGGYSITWSKMTEAQRAAAERFLRGVLSETWAPRIIGQITVSTLVSGERPVTLTITREKGTQATWVWSVVGRDLSLRFAFAAERVVRVGPLSITARGGRASLLAGHDEAATHLMDAMPKALAANAAWGDVVVIEGTTAPRDHGVRGAELPEENRAQVRALLAMTTGLLREDIPTSAGEVVRSEGALAAARLVWAGARHPSLPHAHRIASERFSIEVIMIPARDEEEAVAKLIWDETPPEAPPETPASPGE